MKYILNIAAAALILTSLFISGCDMFDNLPINAPFSVPVIVDGSTNPVIKEQDFCLDQYENYQDISDQINTLTYLEGALRIDSVSSPNLMGNITVTLKTQADQPLFSLVLNNVNPSDYKTNPYVFPLTTEQVQALNQYVSNLDNKCFKAYIRVDVTQGQTPYYVGAFIDLVFEAVLD